MKGGQIMKKVLMVLIFGLVFTAAYAQMDIPLKQGMPNTVTLSNGEVIYDLRGEWAVSVEHYGQWEQFGIIDDIEEIKQEGNSFVGVTLLGTPRSPKGSEKLRGELDKSGFKKVQTITGAGPLDLNGEILQNGNKIILDDGQKLRLTLIRK